MKSTVVSRRILKFDLKDSALLRVLTALAPDGDSLAMGVRETELIQRTGLSPPEALNQLTSLVDKGFVTHKLLQVGTAGASEHYYALVGKCEAQIVVETVGGQP